MMFQDTLNTKNLLTEFGCVIQTGTAELLSFPERKEVNTQDWREENGSEYDLQLPVFKDKEVTLSFAIKADDDTDFWTKYNALFDELKKADWQDLYIYDHSKTYQVYYKKTGNWKKSTKRLKDVDVVFVKFSLTLQVKY